MYVNSALGYPGSIPETVMRTGTIMTFNPMDARQDIRPGHVERVTHLPVAQPPGSAGYGPPPLPPYAMVPSPAATAGLGADGEATSAWAWGLVAVLAAAAGLGAYKTVRG